MKKNLTNHSVSLLFLISVLISTSALAQTIDELTLLDTYHTGIFDDGGAEIPAYDAATQRLFVTNGSTGKIDVIDISDPTNVVLLFSFDIDQLLPGAGITSIAAKNGLVGVTAEDENDEGKVIFFNADLTAATTDAVAIVPVGNLPDMLIFTADGSKVLVANEGEPADDGSEDPEGSVSIINVSDFSVVTADFKAFNGKAEELRAKGVRIFKYSESVAQDLEPEGIALSPDGTTAFVSLQENNAFVVLDIASATVKDILPLGYKNHYINQPVLSQYEINEPPLDADQNILFGGLSGLYFEGMTTDGKYKFITIPDRGPNGDPVEVQKVDDPTQSMEVRPFLIPEYQAQIIKFELDKSTGMIEITEKIDLFRKEGDDMLPISGLPNIPGVDEIPAQPVTEVTDYMDASGNYYKMLDYDAFGADMEGIVMNPADGTFWMVDEYRPAIYHFMPDGMLAHRYVPAGTAALAGESVGTFGTETFPEAYSTRRANRGFEAMALDTDKGILYAFIQTPLANPDGTTSSNSSIIRILGINPADGTPVAEYIYFLEKPAFRSSLVDKIGDAVYDPKTGKFYVIERDSGADPSNKKFIFEIDLKAATNVLGMDFPSMSGKTLEQHTPDELVALDIHPVYKYKVLNLPSLGYLPSDKPEGLTLLPNGSLAVLNDNDFGLVPGLEKVALGIIDFNGMSNALDASNDDGMINITHWPVLGMYQPDGVVGYEADGKTYYVTANEGDSRDYDFYSEEAEVGDDEYMLDPDAFPDAEALKADETLGKLGVTLENGDIDGDGDYDRIFAHGARSFSIWDAYGNLVYDSGDDLEQITADMFPEFFNSSNTESEFDDRSDNKGPEPEGVAIGMIDGHTFAFIGLERMSGIMVFDVTHPDAVEFVTYFNNRDFLADPESPGAGDLGPEGLLFIAAEDSPIGVPLLVAANEISGSTSVYSIGKIPAITGFTLVNAATDEDIMKLTDGAVIDLYEYPYPLNIRADVYPEMVGVVQFGLNEDERHTVEREAPYALFGDTEGDYSEKELMPGSYYVMATPFLKNWIKSDPGQTKSVHFTIINSAGVTGFTLVDAMTNEDIQPLADGAMIDLAELPSKYINIRADVKGEVMKVQFGLNNEEKYRVEKYAPFALFGDDMGTGNYYAWMPDAGMYTITADPTMKGNMEGTSQTITIEIMDSEGATVSAKRSRMQVSAFPNPLESELKINVDHAAIGSMVNYRLTDMYGNVYMQKSYQIIGGTEQIPVDLSRLPLKKGFYFLSIETNDAAPKVIRLMKD